MRTIFLEKSYTKYDGETIPRSFSKNLNRADKSLNLLTFFLSLKATFKKGNGEQQMRNGERGMRLTIFHEILHSEQFGGAEFIDDNSFLWFLTPVNAGICHLLSHGFRRRTVNASILMKLCILQKSKALSSLVTIVFCSFWRSFLTPINFGTVNSSAWEVHVQFSRLHSFRNIKLNGAQSVEKLYWMMLNVGKISKNEDPLLS